MSDLELHAKRRAAAFQQLHTLANNPPTVWDGDDSRGYDAWLAELQSANSRYRRTVKFEQRAKANGQARVTT